MELLVACNSCKAFMNCTTFMPTIAILHMVCPPKNFPRSTHGTYVFVHQCFPKDWFDHSGIMIRFNWVTVAQKLLFWQ